VFSGGNVIISSLTFMSLIHFEKIFCVWGGSGLVSFYCICISNFANTIEHLVFSLGYIPGNFVKKSGEYMNGMNFLVLYFVPLVLVSIFMPAPCCFGFYSSVVCFLNHFIHYT
jgi:hypothetical protein